ncbi:UNVERIFIED_CONTAM: hypothetical protein Sradi_1575900 [Sesamum radiatum]|uniref:Uncharacterized protein n=1 Tax=Sesamum radiatum TaxID=300843 RepID=A0AAW2UA08_SESRA
MKVATLINSEQGDWNCDIVEEHFCREDSSSLSLSVEVFCKTPLFGITPPRVYTQSGVHITLLVISTSRLRLQLHHKVGTSFGQQKSPTKFVYSPGECAGTVFPPAPILHVAPHTHPLRARFVLPPMKTPIMPLHSAILLDKYGHYPISQVLQQGAPPQATSFKQSPQLLQVNSDSHVLHILIPGNTHQQIPSKSTLMEPHSTMKKGWA